MNTSKNKLTQLDKSPLTLSLATSLVSFLSISESFAVTQAPALSASQVTNVCSQLAHDYVQHYDQAVLLGTTSEGHIRSEILWMTDACLKSVSKSGACATQRSNAIKLQSCFDDLICRNKISHSLNLDVFDEAHCND